MKSSDVLESRIGRLKGMLKGLSDKEEEKGPRARIRQIRKRLKRTQRKLRTLRHAKAAQSSSKEEPKT
jgi:hypothetical protein